MLYGIVQKGLVLVGKFYGVVYFGCTVCPSDSFRALRERYYRLDTKKLTSSGICESMQNLSVATSFTIRITKIKKLMQLFLCLTVLGQLSKLSWGPDRSMSQPKIY